MLARLEDKIAGYDLPTQLSKVQAFLSENMNRLANTLDFEKEYRPINLNFGLVDQTFDLYHHQNGREKIFLYEMGSGANWVSCHIALFLSFLRLFANNEKSPILLRIVFATLWTFLIEIRYFPDILYPLFPYAPILVVVKICGQCPGLSKSQGVLQPENRFQNWNSGQRSGCV